MNEPTNRVGWVTAVLFAAALLAILLAGWDAHSTHSALAVARDQLDECAKIATQIASLWQAPDKAEAETRGQDELAKQIEQWSLAARIEPRGILRVAPLAPRRVADSDYEEVGAEVEFASVTLAQLAELADRVARSDGRLKVSDLRLQAPRDDATDGSPQELWNAELALTYLLYSPKSSRR